MTNQDRHAATIAEDEMGHIRELMGVVENLISMMAAGNIGSLKIEYGSLRVALQSKDRSPKTSSTMAGNGSEPTVSPQIVEEIEVPSTDHVVTAPMIGTFYVAPAPNEAPFITPGDAIVEGQTIGIIEAMKIMNEIASDRAGTVLEVVAGDGQTVEYGSALIRIDPSDE